MAGIETMPWPSVSDEEPILTTMRRAWRSLVRSVTGLGVARLGVDTQWLSNRWLTLRRRSTTRSDVPVPFRRGLRHGQLCARRGLGVFLPVLGGGGLPAVGLDRVARRGVRHRWSWWVPSQRPPRFHRHRSPRHLRGALRRSSVLFRCLTVPA